MPTYDFAGTYGPQPITDASGLPLAGLTVAVYAVGTVDLVSLYTDRTMDAMAVNPTTTDDVGNLTFFCAPGQVTVSGNNSSFDTVVPPDPADLANIPGATMTGPLVLAADPTVPLQAATKQYVDDVAGGGSGSGFAPLASPHFTGVPTGPTAALSTNTTQLASTAFVIANASGGGGSVASVFGRTGTVTAQTGDYTVSEITGAAALASPNFTGVPAAPTATPGTNSTQIASTAFVATSFAPLASPSLTGVPSAPTATSGTNTTQLATTAFVTSALTAKANLASPVLTGTPSAPTATVGTNTTQLATTAFVIANAGGGGGSTNVLSVFNVQHYGATGNGTTDDTADIGAAIAAAVAAKGGIVYFPQGTYKTTSVLTVATIYPIQLVGAGWGTIIKPTGSTAFDCIRAYDSTTNSGEGPTNTGFAIRELLIDGTAMTNTTGKASGIHLGDLFRASVINVAVQNFATSTNYGLWFDNNYSWAEQLTVDAFVSNCTIGCVFDVASGASTTSQPFITGSYDRADIKLGINQGTDTFNGLLLNNGAVLLDSRLYVYGNFGANTTTDTAYAVGVVGGTPTGAYIGTMSIITSSFIQFGIEQDTGGSSSGDEPYTVFFGPSITSGGTTYYPQIIKSMCMFDFGAANAFKATNGTANNMSGNMGLCFGDSTLAALV